MTKKQKIYLSLSFCGTLGLAPFFPEPHIWGKLKWLVGGAEGMQLKDYFKSKSNVIFLDYGIKNYKDSLFSDYSHLNNHGNFLLTNELLESEEFISFIK